MKKKKGFTLIEVIVTMVILSVLAAITVPALLGYIDKGREKKCEALRGSILASYLTDRTIFKSNGTFADVKTLADEINYITGEYIPKLQITCPSGGAYSAKDGNDNTIYIYCDKHGDSEKVQIPVDTGGTPTTPTPDKTEPTKDPTITPTITPGTSGNATTDENPNPDKEIIFDMGENQTITVGVGVVWTSEYYESHKGTSGNNGNNVKFEPGTLISETIGGNTVYYITTKNETVFAGSKFPTMMDSYEKQDLIKLPSDLTIWTDIKIPDDVSKLHTYDLLLYTDNTNPENVVTNVYVYLGKTNDESFKMPNEQGGETMWLKLQTSATIGKADVSDGTTE